MRNLERPVAARNLCGRADAAGSSLAALIPLASLALGSPRLRTRRTFADMRGHIDDAEEAMPGGGDLATAGWLEDGESHD
jgi:phosphohistidine phosphatase SixA